MTEIRPPTLAARLLAVMGEVPYIQKGGKTQSGPSFKYVKHDDVVALVRPALVKHGVGFMTGIDENSVGCEQIGETKSGAARYKTTLVLRLTFMNIDDPSDAYSVSFPGEGVDTDDKGSGKALSYALKNGLLKTFMIEAGDEADNEAAAQEPVERPQAVRQDQQREQAAMAQQAAPAAAPPPNGNGTITQAQARRLHEDLFAKGKKPEWFLGVIAGRPGFESVDPDHLMSIPAAGYDHLLEIVAGFADPPPPEPSAPAVASAPAPVVSAEDFTQPAPATQEAAQEVAAPAAASDASEAPVAQTEPAETTPRPDGCTLDKSFQQCAAVKAHAKPDCGSCDHHDKDFAQLDAATRGDGALAEVAAQPKRKKGTISEGMLKRLGIQCAELEELGVGREEWRLYMLDKEGVSSRTELTKAAATRVIDYLARWIVDIRTGVAGPGERAVA